MSGPALTLSRNELAALLKRVFEALFSKSCDFEAMAEQVVWLECHGLGGLDLLRTCLDDLEGADPKSVRIESTSGDRVLVDARGTSMLCLSDLIADMAIARCSEQGASRIEVSHCRDPQAIVPQLSRIGASGHCAAAYWQGGSGNSPSYARVKGGSGLPGLSGWGLPAGSPEAGRLTILIASSDTSLDQSFEARLRDWPDPEITPEILEKRNHASLNDGIAVDDVSRLNRIADRVLVEASAASRQGAGE